MTDIERSGKLGQVKLLEDQLAALRKELGIHGRSEDIFNQPVDGGDNIWIACLADGEGGATVFEDGRLFGNRERRFETEVAAMAALQEVMTPDGLIDGDYLDELFDNPKDKE